MKTFEIGGNTVRGRFVSGRGDTLIVFAHGLGGTVEKMGPMSDAARSLRPDADQFIPEMRTGLLCLKGPEQIARELADDIAALDARRNYSNIILVGHSAGAMVARAAWLRAAGAQDDGSPGGPVQPWSGKVERIVLMAAINRGWSDSVAIGIGRKLQFWSLSIIEFFLYGLLQRWAKTSGYTLELRRGAPFVTGLRLKWLAMARARTLPLMIQVLGTIDDIVSPKDNVDLIAGDGFVYLEAPASGHASMIRLNEPGLGEARTRVFSLALTGDRAALDAANLATEVADNLSDGQDDFDEDLSDAAPQRALVQRVVFVIHGIRDYGFWTKKIAGRAKREGGGPTMCRTVTSSYGFFPMGPFIFKALRRRRIEWLMDQYVRARALYPNAVFSYMGHSNGTALLAGAMSLSPAIRFDRVVFAGSVVRRDFDWSGLTGRGQVGSVMNYVATNDYIVAAFPKFLQRLPYADLGSAGFDGFTRGGIHEIEYVRGGHDAALRETLWGQAARFLVGKDAGAADGQGDILGSRGWRLALANGLGSWIGLPTVVAIIVLPGLAILLLLKWPAWGVALSFLIWVWFVKTVLTRL